MICIILKLYRVEKNLINLLNNCELKNADICMTVTCNELWSVILTNILSLVSGGGWAYLVFINI